MFQKQQKPSTFELSKNRKGQGLSMNVIIIAAIALLVLVILSVLVLRAGRTTTEGTSLCQELSGAICEDATAGCEDNFFRQRSREADCDDDEICCVPLT